MQTTDKKQTALNWFINKIIENNNLSEINISLFHILEAKEMEKEQIIDTFEEGYRNGYANDAEDYYNETYIFE